MRVDAEIENVIDLFVKHLLRQPERRDLACSINPPPLNCSSKRWISYPSGARSRATVSDAGPAPISATFLPFGANGPCGISGFTIVLIVGGHAFEAADGDGLFVDAAAAACGFARAVARAAENARETHSNPS